MTRNVMALVIAILLLAACTPDTKQSSEIPLASAIIVADGDAQHSFTLEDLQAFTSTEASFNDVIYKGIPVSTLLEAADVNLDEMKALKAYASDGYTVNYDPSQIFKENVLVAYAYEDGSPLTGDDGKFRMVLPEEGGSFNLRMLTKLQVIK